MDPLPATTIDPEEAVEMAQQRARKLRCPFCFNFQRYCNCRQHINRPAAIDTTSSVTEAIEATCREA